MIKAQIEQAINETTKRSERQVAVLLVDLDHFKEINISFGSTRWRRAVAPSCLPAAVPH